MKLSLLSTSAFTKNVIYLPCCEYPFLFGKLVVWFKALRSLWITFFNLINFSFFFQFIQFIFTSPINELIFLRVYNYYEFLFTIWFCADFVTFSSWPIKYLYWTDSIQSLPPHYMRRSRKRTHTVQSFKSSSVLFWCAFFSWRQRFELKWITSQTICVAQVFVRSVVRLWL